ncbi:mannose-1-phosphate guanylyltransferase [Empedobacter sp.]|uniref:mannose-1-phosphate guanylyltransferase n=1 Tax=Empedobacter sp. TaxID=1927715 RepID=UPI00289F96DC|nr:mannose-1-phosphate guanylyltransferase [Empedobacter sp.]
MKTVNVILSGGVGSRLWPLSRKSNPKQFLKLFSGKSLFQLTAERNASLVDEIMVVGNEEHIDWSKDFLKDLDLPKNYIIESQPRNTAAAIAFAAFAMNPEDIMIVTPSDHLIENQEEYDAAIKRAIDLAKNDFVVTFGIVPSKPETGYGYIEHQRENVLSFREKPNLDTAQEFIEKGNFLWNSGMFCFKAGILLEELKNYQPDVYSASKEAWNNAKDGVIDAGLSSRIPSISIDYAVMERSKKIKVVPARFRWNDLGSYESLYDYLKGEGHPVDNNGNMVIGTSIFSAFVGLSNTIVVVTDDALLLLQKEYAQDVKKVYNQLEKYKSVLR